MNEGLKNIFSEDEIMRRLKLTKDQLDGLRRDRNFPFIQITKSSRAYLESDVMRWLQQNKKNAGSAIQLELPKPANQED